jgi:hypothetical protein
VDTSTLTLAAFILVPVILLMALRINATLVFLSLCLGDVLVQFVSPDANQFFTLFSAQVQKGIDSGNATIKILLLLVPVVLTSVFMIKTVKGNGKLALNLLPSAGVGLLGSVLLVPLLPSDISRNIVNSNLWSQVDRAQDLIVGGSAVVCLLVLWLQRPKTSIKGEKHSKH